MLKLIDGFATVKQDIKRCHFSLWELFHLMFNLVDKIISCSPIFFQSTLQCHNHITSCVFSFLLPPHIQQVKAHHNGKREKKTLSKEILSLTLSTAVVM